MLASVLMAMAAGIIGLLGTVHLLYTYRGPKLTPRNPEVIRRMQDSALVLTRETSVWRAWIGFNASHSLGAILFALCYGYLALREPTLLFASPFLLTLALLTLAAWLWLAWRYWFRVPFTGIGLAFACGLGAVLATLLG